MTRQETFKRRIRTRMAKTGERYGAARRALLPADGNGKGRGGRTWADQPEHSDETIRDETGRGWEEWCDLIDAWPGHDDGHGAIAAHVAEAYGIEGWWAQSVTLGYERITGIRVRHQRADGTFSAGKTKTVTIDREALRAMLLDDEDRADLFPGFETELRSKPASKVPRIAIGPGIALISLEPRPDGRTTIAIAHERLPDAAAVAEWKAYWGDWLEALDEG